MRKSTTPEKPGKPYADFPLFPHATRRWAKKIRGKLHYFGPWSDPDAALDEWLRVKDHLLAGRTPPPRGDENGLTVRGLVNVFLTAKKQAMDSGELSPRMFTEYHTVCAKVLDSLGKDRQVSGLTPADFAQLRAFMAKNWGPTRLGGAVQRVRTVFKYAFDNQLIDKPVFMGTEFKKPPRHVMRKVRAAHGPLVVEAHEARALLDAAAPQLRAMIYLGLQAGFGNGDCASLPLAAVDLKAGWITHPRPKTGIVRRIPLWAETSAALEEVIATRPKPKTDEAGKLVFVTRCGKPWGQYSVEVQGDKLKLKTGDPIYNEFAKLTKKLGIARPRLGFYALRHTFQTVAEESRDLAAVMAIMGHVPHDRDMSSAYRERISDDRLQHVVGHVRTWLGEGGAK